MILFVNNNRGFLFLSGLIVVLKKIVYRSKITLLTVINTIVTTFMDNSTPIVTRLLINSTVYPPQPVYITNEFAESRVQTILIINSLITIDIRHSTKLIDNG